MTLQALIHGCSNIFYNSQTLLMLSICLCFRIVHTGFKLLQTGFELFSALVVAVSRPLLALVSSTSFVLGVLIFLVPSWLSHSGAYFLSKEILPSFASLLSDPAPLLQAVRRSRSCSAAGVQVSCEIIEGLSYLCNICWVYKHLGMRIGGRRQCTSGKQH